MFYLLSKRFLDQLREWFSIQKVQLHAMTASVGVLGWRLRFRSMYRLCCRVYFPSMLHFFRKKKLKGNLR